MIAIQHVIDIANDLAMYLVGQCGFLQTPLIITIQKQCRYPPEARFYSGPKDYMRIPPLGDEPRNEFSLRPEQAWLGEHVRAGILVSPSTKWRPYRSARLLPFGETPLRIRRVPPRADRSLTKSFPRPGVLEPDGQVSASQRRLRK